MKIGSARMAAFEWVERYASREEGFMGAYFSGSTVGKPDDAEMPVASDLDLVVVNERAELPLKLGKFVYRDTLLEVTNASWSQLASKEEVLTSYHLAGSFREDTIFADPTGQLRGMQIHVSRHFAEKVWVRRRCENALQKISNGLRSIDSSAPLCDQVTAWLFPTGVSAHVILVAALRNPTIRLRYIAAREALQGHGHADFYPKLLHLLGCDTMTPPCVEHHLDELALLFDTAAANARTPFFFSSDITPAARPIAIEGSRELIHTGFHREAMFWIVATFARCHKILTADAPELQPAFAPAFDAVIADLGIRSASDILIRAEESLRFLPGLLETAEAVMSANPGIVDR
ncbi:hypothetical protein FE784_10605 [Paenibacillus hemerocallicola]|uniref:Uncharacterized protein n=1 Tax=Paenibacillus hemerocallicola TaxID=1172614 RepID=A0A5C4TBE5_9BACL|nr:hypothetical protein [Paenibacillus hemerocallicola]TNJ66418.1 hypothetical protein FE784_10605 [Paenibacillus hemerocallicola]